MRIAGQPLPVPREAALRRFRVPGTGEAIDRGLALWFPSPASATGEDVAEFHLHGGPAVLAALADALGDAAGPAPRRARRVHPPRLRRPASLDLTEAEGIADLVAAETEAQRRQALRQMEGGLHRLYDGWRDRLMALRANVEAAIDFSDQDLGDDPLVISGPGSCGAGGRDRGPSRRCAPGRAPARGLHHRHRGRAQRRKVEPAQRLAGRDAAIVSARAGTTRDVVEVRLDLAGWPVTLADTAGLRESGDEIESEGVRRALDRAARADLSLVVFDGALWPEAR